MDEAVAIGFVVASVALATVELARPYWFARFAVVPVLQPARIGLSASAAARLLARDEAPQTYRSASPIQRLDWAALGGEAEVERGAITMRLDAPRSRVIAWPTSSNRWLKTIVRVDVHADSDGLLLRARHFPDGLWILAMVLAVGVSGFDVRRYLYVVALVAGLISLVVSLGRARDALATVAEELKARADLL